MAANSSSAGLNELRHRLLDMSKRNPLIHTPVNNRNSKQILVVDEKSDEIHRILFNEEKKFTFLPKADDDAHLDEDDAIFVPDELEAELHAKHTDTKLQTELTPEALQKKLLALFREARTIEEELSVSVLFLALGFIRYYDAESSDVARYGPLLLLPVDLERRSTSSMFGISARDDDLGKNQNLAQMLQQEHNVLLPDLPTDSGWRASDFFSQVQDAISSKPRWEVEQDRMVLRFYSFEKFMMSRDLEDDSVTQFNSDDGASLKLVHQLLGGESGASTTSTTGLSVIENARNLDKRFEDPRDLGHILDADTSQTQVIDAALSGRNLVVQGPPGTGKSQTIANIIASAASAGKRVLFIAEKKAALDVVFQRLRRCGLGRLCLELHSHKANRKQVYESIKKTLDESPLISLDERLYDDIKETRDELNRMNDLIHTVDEQTGNTPYLIMGRIAQLTGREIPPPEYTVEGIDSWSKDDFETKFTLFDRWIVATKNFGLETEHPFRGVRRNLSPLERTRLEQSLAPHVELTQRLIHTASESRLFESALPVNTVHSCRQRLAHLRAMENQPDGISDLLDKKTVQDEYRSELLKLIDDMLDYQRAKTNLDSSVTTPAFEQDWEFELATVVQSGESIFRWFKGSYRNAVAKLKSALKIKLPDQLDERLTLLKELVRMGELRREILARENLGRSHFDLAWSGTETSCEVERDRVNWVHERVSAFGALDNLTEAIAQSTKLIDLKALIDQFDGYLQRWVENWTQIVEETDFDSRIAFGTESIDDLSLHQVNDRIKDWLSGMESIVQYHQLRAVGEELERVGLGIVREHVNTQRLKPEVAVDSLMLHRCEAVYNRFREQHPELLQINGEQRTQLVAKFKTLDTQLKELAIKEALRKHDLSIPKGSVGAMGTIRGEINKKRSHMPIRKLLDTVGDAVASIKPVFLMSPISVSRFLKPGGLTFDLLLMDEASQIKPEESIGAILRAKQVVVVGDQKQMPPSSFFDKQVMDEEDDEDEDLTEEEIRIRQTSQIESVLSLCEARGFDQALLSWHYRSEHPSLIEVSNHEFYDSRLIYPPTPDFGKTSTGLKFHKVNGIYERSRGRYNKVEATTICEHIANHVRNYPGQSLGVVALSVAQRNMLQNMVDDLCRENPDIERYCYEQNDEPFFVKNLENVQGDERDVIYISIGYGRDADGYFGQNFGPVSSDGGERRLNVLFTRARKQCVIFASITHDDIRIDAARHQGPRVLKQFLRYAETGTMDAPLITGEEMDSPFEQDVAQTLTERGFRVEAQVGSAGFKIDLAVHDPENEGHFLLAIECDGARYHSSSWARERDRLRQEVLEGKGWRFHRIWSTDWFTAREREIAKLLDAITLAKSSQAGDDNAAVRVFETEPVTEHVTGMQASDSSPIEVVARGDQQSLVAEPYVEAEIRLSYRQQQTDLLEVQPEELESVVRDIVTTEQPVHIDLVMRKVANAWGLARIGNRIRSHLQYCLIRIQNHGEITECEEDPGFLRSSIAPTSAILRDRSECTLVEYQDSAHLPRAELQLAILEIVGANVTVPLDACVREVIRLLGVKRNRATLLERVREETSNFVRDKKIEFDGETLVRQESPH